MSHPSIKRLQDEFDSIDFTVPGLSAEMVDSARTLREMFRLWWQQSRHSKRGEVRIRSLCNRVEAMYAEEVFRPIPIVSFEEECGMSTPCSTEGDIRF